MQRRGGEQPHPGRRNGAHGQLPLGTDVPDIGPEADRQPGGDEDQRHRLHQQLGHAVKARDRPDEEGVQGLEWRQAERGEQRPATEQRQRDGDQRGQQVGEA
nr:hypothetical protein [Oceanicola sp. S124]